jgi:tetratricopeptide (TPR) repeat protein
MRERAERVFRGETATGGLTVNPAVLFAEAVARHQAGAWPEAERLYRQVLEADPAHANACHMLGVLATQTGNHAQAVHYIEQALRQHPQSPILYANLGLAYHGLGKLDAAVASLQHAVRLEPAYAEAHYNLGLVFVDQGEFGEAEGCYREAVRCKPQYAAAYNNLGNLYRMRGEWQQAESCHREALRLEPANAAAHNNLGNTLRDQAKPALALAHYRQAIGLQENYASAHYNLGLALSDLDRQDEAIAAFSHAVHLQPDMAEAHYNLGVSLAEQKRYADAEASYKEAIRCRPHYAEAVTNLGVVLADQERFDEAVACYEQGLRWQPDHAVAWNNLGNARKEQGRLDDAVACYGQALQSRPDFAEALSDLGVVLALQGRFADALASYRRALEIKPDYADAHCNRALALLLQGDYLHGFAEYEWRWKKKVPGPRLLPQPLWDGSPLAGRTVLLHAEQGLGDALQFVRYVPLVKERGGTVILECQRPLVRLLASGGGYDRLLAHGEPLPSFDVHAPLMSLPWIFRTDLANVPAAVPYLHADPDRLAQWGRRVTDVPGFKVGIVWQGNPKNKADRFRSFPLALLAPLTRLEGVHVFSLQKGFGSEQLQHFAERRRIVDWTSEMDVDAPFLDTAAVMRHLDLVIAPETGPAHLAGALGLRTWVVLAAVPDWRWLLDRDDSPWYPTMRLFRQRIAGDWEEVLGRVAEEVKLLSAPGLNPTLTPTPAL